MVRCSNADCTNGKWFHIGFMGIDQPPSEEVDWNCSEDCQGTERSIFCCCHSVKPGAKVKCSRGVDCVNGTLFHSACVGLDNLRNSGTIAQY